MIKEYQEATIEFIGEIKGLIGEQFFEHYYLINAINEILNKNSNSYEAYIIWNNSNSWIIGLRVDGNYLIYGKNWNTNLIQQTISRIDFDMYQPNYHFSGTNKLVTEILKSADRDLKVFKDRIFYACSKLNDSFENKKFENLICDKIDLEEIAQMLCDYFEEEYKGENNKEFSLMLRQVSKQIENKALWNLKFNGEIKSICSIIETSKGNPIIGSFFTKKDERSKGYGSSLVKFVTSFLLNNTDEVWLISDKSSIASNRVFKKIGYLPAYESIDVLIK